MEIHQIRYFLAVVANRHFGRAAAECNVTQPALTRAIQKLEHELGGMLLIRKPNQIELTELGRKVFPNLRQAYTETSQAKAEAKAFSKRRMFRLRVGVMCTIGPWLLAEMTARLARQEPNLDIIISQAGGRECVESLIQDDIDVAIVGLPEYPPSVSVRLLYRESYAVVFPRGHRFAGMMEVPLAELATENYLEHLSCEFMDFYEKRFGEPLDILNMRHASESEDWIQAMVLAGMGCAMVPENYPILPDLLRRPLCRPSVDREIGVLYARGAALSEPAKAFIEIVTNSAWPALPLAD